jgi:hypothetical protein
MTTKHKYGTKEDYAGLFGRLASDFEADTEGNLSAVIVFLDSRTANVGVYGMNVAVEDIPEILEEAADVVAGHVEQQDFNRTLN